MFGVTYFKVLEVLTSAKFTVPSRTSLKDI